MNKETEQSLAQIKKLVDEQKHDPRQKFMRMKEATAIYHMSRTKLAEAAIDAGAFYKLGGTVLINIEIFDKYLETFRIPGMVM